MRTLLFILIIASLPSLGQEMILNVINPASFDRLNETIEISFDEIQEKLQLLHSSLIGVFENEKQIVSQVVDLDGDGKPDVLLFQSPFKGKEEKQFIIREIPTQPNVANITDAKYILPRKDIAWENDRIAYRIYGGPLAGDVQNGIDVWVKRVRYHVIDKWYHGDSLKGKQRISYHLDHGEGADFFTVGKSLGAGGCAIWLDSVFVQNKFFSDFKIISTGPIRSIFKVKYDGIIGNKHFNEIKTYSLDAGENLNRISVRYEGIGQDTICIAVGLVKRNNIVYYFNEQKSWLSVWGLTNDDTTNGYLGTGIIFTNSTTPKLREDENHYLMIGSIFKEKEFVYYAGAGWSRSGDFNSETDWRHYLDKFALRFNQPLIVNFQSDK